MERNAYTRRHREIDERKRERDRWEGRGEIKRDKKIMMTKK